MVTAKRETMEDESVSKAVMNSPLFKLPPELRNIIYRLCIVDPEVITIDVTKTLEPELLFVCRAIRREALSIFYGDNKFRITTVDCNSDLDHQCCLRWRRMTRREGVGTPKMTAGKILVRNPNWSALKVWARRIYDNTVITKQKSRGTHEPSKHVRHSLIRALLNTVEALRKRGTAWEAVEEVIDLQRQVFITTDPEWAR